MTAAGSENYPLASVGVPIFNEATHLASALGSLLAQDYPNIEIMVSDNGSTDRTQEICLDYAEREVRLKYHRQSENRGAAFNSNQIVERSSGEYFLRASSHDTWSPGYISVCVAELGRRLNAVIAFGSTEWISESGAPYPKETGWTDMRGMSALERFFTQLWGNMHPIMGLARIDAVRRALPFADMAAADLAFLLEMPLLGEFIHAPGGTWYRRETRGPQSYRERMQRYRDKSFGLVKSRLGALFPYRKLLMRIPRIVLRSDVPLSDKAILLTLVYPTTIGRYIGARERQRFCFRPGLARSMSNGRLPVQSMEILSVSARLMGTL
jgi:glycosyltransferase involved in cell wall biosynthesis